MNSGFLLGGEMLGACLGHLGPGHFNISRSHERHFYAFMNKHLESKISNSYVAQHLK